eukprot:scaffold23052_cov38-Prasinocladus_malaysianus.AAC.2
MPQRCSRSQRSGRARPGVVSVRAAVEAQAPLAREGPIIINGQILHSISKERLEIVNSLDGWAEKEVHPAVHAQ